MVYPSTHFVQGSATAGSNNIINNPESNQEVPAGQQSYEELCEEIVNKLHAMITAVGKLRTTTERSLIDAQRPLIEAKKLLTDPSVPTEIQTEFRSENPAERPAPVLGREETDIDPDVRKVFEDTRSLLLSMFPFFSQENY